MKLRHLLYSLFALFAIAGITSCDEKPKTGDSNEETSTTEAGEKSDEGSNQETSNSSTDGTIDSSLEPFSELWYEEKKQKLANVIDQARAGRESEPVRIRGTILNAAGKDITLDKLAGEIRFEPISTTIINEEGVFELDAETDQPQMFQLRFDGSKAIPLWLEGGNYEITADFENWDEYQINSPESYKLKEYLLILDAHNARVQKMADHQDEIMDADHLEAYLRDSARTLQAELEAKKFNALKNFIENNKSSAMAAEAANRINLLRYTDYGMMVYERTKKLYPYSSYVKNLGLRLLRFEHLTSGSVMPNFTLPDIEGTNYALEDYRGKYLLLHLTTAYFNQCRDFHKELVFTYDRFHPEGLEILGYCMDEEEEALKDILEKDGLKWPMVSDLIGSKSIMLSKYPAFDPPMTYLIDPEGKLIAKGLTVEELEEKLMKLLF